MGRGPLLQPGAGLFPAPVPVHCVCSSPMGGRPVWDTWVPAASPKRRQQTRKPRLTRCPSGGVLGAGPCRETQQRAWDPQQDPLLR